MTHLGTTLATLIDELWPSQRAFAEACGINHATLHHVINGRPCSRENLRLFCQYISTNPLHKYEVLISHLRDEADASGVDSSKIVVRAIAEPSLNELRIPADLKDSLALIADEASKEKDVGELIANLARMIRSHRARVQDLEAKLIPFSSKGGAPLPAELGLVAEESRSTYGTKVLPADVVEAQIQAARAKSKRSRQQASS